MILKKINKLKEKFIDDINKTNKDNYYNKIKYMVIVYNANLEQWEVYNKFTLSKQYLIEDELMQCMATIALTSQIYDVLVLTDIKYESIGIGEYDYNYKEIINIYKNIIHSNNKDCNEQIKANIILLLIGESFHNNIINDVILYLDYLMSKIDSDYIKDLNKATCMKYNSITISNIISINDIYYADTEYINQIIEVMLKAAVIYKHANQSIC